MTESEFAAPVADLTEGRWARVFRGLVDRGCVLTIINPPRPTPPRRLPRRPPLSQGDLSVGRGAMSRDRVGVRCTCGRLDGGPVG